MIHTVGMRKLLGVCAVTSVLAVFSGLALTIAALHASTAASHNSSVGAHSAVVAVTDLERVLARQAHNHAQSVQTAKQIDSAVSRIEARVDTDIAILRKQVLKNQKQLLKQTGPPAHG